MAQLSEGLGLDLADAFPGDVELLADLLQGAGAAVLNAEAQDVYKRQGSVHTICGGDGRHFAVDESPETARQCVEEFFGGDWYRYTDAYYDQMCIRDRILTLLTQEAGRLTASARGCRRKGSPIAAGSQLLVWSDVVLHEYLSLIHI